MSTDQTDVVKVPEKSTIWTAVAMPILDSVPGEAFANHVVAIVETARHTNIKLLTPFNTIPHDRARMSAHKMAVDAGCDYIFWIDDDTMCPVDSFEHLLKTMVEHGAVAVSGFYYRRGYPYTSVWSVAGPNGGDAIQVTAPDGIHEIDYSGLGCCLVDLKWVQKNLQPPYYTMMMEENKTCTNVTDDVSFFSKVRAAGGKVLGNANIRCGHLGERTVICDRTADALREAYVKAATTSNG